jgi:hypothetical protein
MAHDDGFRWDDSAADSSGGGSPLGVDERAVDQRVKTELMRRIQTLQGRVAVVEASLRLVQECWPVCLGDPRSGDFGGGLTARQTQCFKNCTLLSVRTERMFQERTLRFHDRASEPVDGP